MSANNKLEINKSGDIFYLSDLDIEALKGFTVGEYKSLEEAIKAAQDYMEENIVEYGLDIQRNCFNS